MDQLNIIGEADLPRQKETDSIGLTKSANLIDIIDDGDEILTLVFYDNDADLWIRYQIIKE